MSSAPRPYLTIVTGAPRSGTSMMMRMLEAGGIEPLADGVREADRDNPRGYYEFEPVKRLRDDTSWVADSAGRVVKMVYALLDALPAAADAGVTYRVVLMRRDLGEVVRSQRLMLERLGRPLGKLSDERKIAMFRSHLDKLEKELPARPGFSLCVMNYNELLTDAAPHVERLHAFLDGNLDLDAMSAVVEPSLYRNRQS